MTVRTSPSVRPSVPGDGIGSGPRSATVRTADRIAAARFHGKVAIVTGGTSGIGAEAARRLASEGASVLITGRSAQRGRAVLASLGTGGAFIAADLTEPGAATRVVEAALSTYGRVDVLVNNAALDHAGPLLDTPVDEAREVFEVNVFAALAMLQCAARAMLTDGGAIVNVSSRLASVGAPTMAIYGASKGALSALTRSAAVELAPHRIRVNAVAPGMTRTPLFDAWCAQQAHPAGAEDRVVAAIPQGRLAEAADVAAAIVFLACDDASHVTGVSLAVDGGYTAT
jgi:NAD(P)-dependent dehydrogenase (short-subunit alcohol dehydrogenase family)